MLTIPNTQKQAKKSDTGLFRAFQEFFEVPLWVVSDPQGMPMQINGSYAKCNDPATWQCFETIINKCEDSFLPAICLQKQSRLIFIDLDHVRNPQTEEILPWAKQLIEETESYVEISRSGTGVHIFFRGNPPELREEKLRFKASNVQGTNSDIEIYYESKFATITGNILTDLPIREISNAEITRIYRKFFTNDSGKETLETETQSPPLTDDEVLRLARSAANGMKFVSLYENGAWEGPDDESAKDLSLASHLAFYTQNLEQIKRIMTSSSLFRQKWEREDYLDRTINKAISSLKKTYQNMNGKISTRGNPIPIKLSSKTTGEPFPIDCLPPILRNMAEEIRRVTKTPTELCCGSVLTAASIATKRFVKVFEKEDLTHYTCFFFMMIAESGERKSSVMKKALDPIYKFQEQDKERYLQEKRSYTARQKAIQRECNTILGLKDSTDQKTKALESLQLQLESYRPKPYRYLTDDFTNAALFKLLDECNGSFAVMSLDGGNVLDYIQGSGPGTDGSLNDSLLLKATWGDPISRDRKSKTEEGEHLFINDPACHVSIVVTPERCVKFLSDPRLRDSGMIARVMPITCTSTIGFRFEKEQEEPYNKELVEKYNECIDSLFQREKLIETHLSDEAAKARRNCFNEIEQEMARGRSLDDLRDLGSKFTTQVTRLAALFQVYKDQPTPTTNEAWIAEKTWYEAEAVARWIFDQAAHLQRTDYDELILVTAKDISNKIQSAKLAKDSSNPVFKRREFQQRFKRELKKIKSHGKQENPVSDVLNTLVTYRWIVEVPSITGQSRSPEYIVNTKKE